MSGAVPNREETPKQKPYRSWNENRFWVFRVWVNRKLNDLMHAKFCLTQSGYLNTIDTKPDFQVAEDAHTIYNT